MDATHGHDRTSSKEQFVTKVLGHAKERWFGGWARVGVKRGLLSAGTVPNTSLVGVFILLDGSGR